MARTPFDPFASVGKRRKPIPFEFVLDWLMPLGPETRLMFGSTAVYVDDRIVLILRERGDTDDGVWVVYDVAFEDEVLGLLPRLKVIDLFENKVKGWKKLAVSDDAFEGDVERLCSFLLAGDKRFGKVPKPKRPRGAAKKKAAPKKAAPKRK